MKRTTLAEAIAAAVIEERRRFALMGAKARAAKLDAKRRSEIASMGGKAKAAKRKAS